MKSQRRVSWGILLCSAVAAACGSSSSGGGAGGNLGKGGAIGTGGVYGSDGGLGYGGVLGSGGSVATGGSGAGGGLGPVDAQVDVPSPTGDGVDAARSPIDTAVEVGAIDGGTVTFLQVRALISERCASCHTGAGSAATRLDLTDSPGSSTTLYQRLLGPVLLEAYCGENIDAGGDAAVARRAIVPGDPASSFLYLKITGTQPSPGNPPANCGSRMPRMLVPGVDGGAPTLPSCDSLDGGAAANCLGAVDIELVRQWILEGAPGN